MPRWETHKVGLTRRGKPVYGFVPSGPSFTSIGTDESDGRFYIDIAGFYINNTNLLINDDGLIFINKPSSRLKRIDNQVVSIVKLETANGSNAVILNEIADGITVVGTLNTDDIILGTSDDITVGLGGSINFPSGVGGGQIKHSPNPPSSPSYSFIDDIDTGVYRETADSGIIRFASDGVQSAFIGRDRIVTKGGFYSVPFGEPIYSLVAGSDITLTALDSPRRFLIDAVPTGFYNAILRDGSVSMEKALKVSGNSSDFGIVFKNDLGTGIKRNVAGNLTFVKDTIEGVIVSSTTLATIIPIQVAATGSTFIGDVGFNTPFGSGTIEFGGAFDTGTHLENNDGTAAAPSYSFRNDDNTGIFRIADNKLGISADGLKQVTVTRQAVTVEGGFYSKSFGEPVYGLIAGSGITIEPAGIGRFTISAPVGGAGDPGFYGINIGSTFANRPTYKGINTIKFEDSTFYVTVDSTNSDEAIVTFRGRPNTTRYTLQGGVPNVGGTATTAASYGNDVAVGDPTMVFYGAVVALSISLSSARTAGTCTVQIAKNSVLQTGSTQTVEISASTSNLKNFKRIVPIKYAAGDNIGIRTVTASFTPTTSDATVLAYCEEDI